MPLFLAVIVGLLLTGSLGQEQEASAASRASLSAVSPADWQRARSAIDEARFADALPLAQKILETVEAVEPVDEGQLVEALELLARAQFHLGLYAEVEDLFLRAISLREARLQALGADADYNERSILGNNYTGLAVSLGARLRLDEAIDLLWRGVQVFRDLGEATRAEADLLLALYQIYLMSDRESEAEKVLEDLQTLFDDISSTLAEEEGGDIEVPRVDFSEPGLTALLGFQVEMLEDEDDEDFIAVLRLQKQVLAVLQAEDGDHNLAETTLRDLVNELEQVPGADLERAYVESQLAGLLLDQGPPRLDEALGLYGKALATLEASLGTEHFDLTFPLDGLGRAHQALGRFEEAEAAYRRCLDLRREQLTIEHPFVAHTLGKLVLLYAESGRSREEYGGMLGAACGIYRRNFAHFPDRVRACRLALLDRQLDRDVRREEIFRRNAIRGLELLEAQRGPDHPDVADFLANEIQPLRFGGRHTEAESRLHRIVEIRRKALDSHHPMVAFALHDLAESYRLRGQLEESLPFAEQASRIWRRRLLRMGYEQGEDIWRQQRTGGSIFRTHLRILADLAPLDSEGLEDPRGTAFELSQLASGSRSAIAVARLASRFDDSETARLARDHQDAVREFQELGEALIEELARPSGRRPEVEERLATRRADLESQLAVLGSELRRLVPEYAELVFPRPVDLTEVQERLLGPREALILFVTEQNASFMVPERSTYVWWVTGDVVRFHRSTLAGEDLDTAVRTLREHLDPGAGRGGRLLGVEPTRSYDLDTAHTLYLALLAPFAEDFDRVDHVVVVPDGPLNSLPLGVLIEALPEAGAEDLGNTPWLADRFALSVVPSVASLDLLRSRVPTPESAVRFLGVGAPNLARGNRGDVAITMESSQDEGKPYEILDLRGLSPLPESSVELRRLAITLDPTGGSNSDLLLYDKATEAQVRALDLKRYNILSFATHGLMASELDGLSEPALVLTPPASALSSDDDGLLTAGEIATLNLRADWVILSACNTASSDGTPNAEGFSGLARAFLYAGSRTLLVSHWYVVSDAAVEINVRLFEILSEEPNLGRAEALRRATRDVRRSGGPGRAHPRFWAPFVLVGDGASSSVETSGGKS